MTEALEYKARCAVSSCERLAAKRGWCQMHYHRWKRNGDPELLLGRRFGPDNPRWRGDAASYEAVHLRLRKQRGLASEQSCAHCGGQAAHWAFVYDPDDTRARPYSTDLTRYIPLCRACHGRFDALRRRLGPECQCNCHQKESVEA